MSITKTLRFLVALLLLIWAAGSLAQVDTDGDGYEDSIDAFPLDPSEWLDNDNDGLGNNLEAQIGTSPDNPDSDGDSLSDQLEYTSATTDPRRYDTDSDGLWDDEEPDYGTDPQIDDSDGDGVLDGTEVAAGSDPTDPAIAYERQWVVDWAEVVSSGCYACTQSPIVDVSAAGTVGLQAYDYFSVATGSAPITFFSQPTENGNNQYYYPGAAALSLDGNIWAEVSRYTRDNNPRYLRTNQASDNANDRRILAPSGGYFINWMDLDEDGDTLAVYHSTGKTYVYRWTGFQWISKGLPLTGNRAKLSADGDSLILQSSWDVKRYLWTGQTWSEVSSDAIGTNNYLTDATTDLQYIATYHSGYDIVSPETFDVGGAQVYSWSGATYDTLGNFIDGQTSNFNLSDAHVSETGDRLLVTNKTTYREYLREGDRWRFAVEFVRPTADLNRAMTANLETVLTVSYACLGCTYLNNSNNQLALLSLDADGDGLGASLDAFPTDPAASVDTDGDGMPDAWNEGYTEADSITGLVLDPYPTQTPDEVDRDFDGVTDSDEAVLGTDPDDPDSDDDGFTDGEEVDAGTNPLDASVFPQPSISLVSLSEVYLSEPITIDVTVTDPLSVSSVKLYYRKVGDTTYSVLDMTGGDNDLYSGQVPAVFVTAAGVEYYIIATNPRVSGYLGSFTLPNLISVDAQPVMLSVDPPEGLSTGGTVLSLEGHNFALGMTLSVGGNNCVTNAYVSSQLMRCTTPPGVPGIASVGLSTSGGDEYVLPAAFSYVGSQAEVRIMAIGREGNEAFDMPIVVNQLNDLNSFVATVTYDATRLQFNGLSLVNDATSWLVAADGATPGTVSIAMSRAEPFSGQGQFFNLNFTPLQQSTQLTPVTFSTIRLNDGAIPTLVFAGGYYWTPTFTLSGRVTNQTDEGESLPADIMVDGISVGQAEVTSGVWSVSEVVSGQRVVTARVTASDNDAIRASDASRVLRHLVGDEVSLVGGLAVADVDGSGTITAQDATQILQLASGLRALPFDGQLTNWRTQPAQIQLDISADTSDIEFFGLLVGDVTGNWTASAASQQAMTNSKDVLTFGNARTNDAGNIDVDLIMGEANLAIEALELSFSINGSSKFISVDGLPDDWLQIVHTQGQRVTVVAAGASFIDLASQGVAPTLSFSGAAGSTVISDIRGWVNEETISFGDLFIEIAVDSDGDGIPDDDDAFPQDPTETLDTDGDGKGNNADTDDDDDGTPDDQDAFPLDATESTDSDHDGVGDNADACDNTLASEIAIIDEFGCAPSDVYTDGDGIADRLDLFPYDRLEWLDTDADGWGDNIEMEAGSSVFDPTDVPILPSTAVDLLRRLP